MSARKVLFLLALTWSVAAVGEESATYLKVKKLIDLLVQQGVIKKQDADALIQEAEAEAKAKEESKTAAAPPTAGGAAAESGKAAVAGAGAGTAATSAAVETTGVKAAGGTAASTGAAAVATGNGTAAVASVAGKAPPSKYVAYVPEFLKDEIRKQVRSELKDEVLQDVKAHAKQQKWGIPDALPAWISRIAPFFDMRLRLADDLFQPTNAQYFDWLAINRLGGISQAMVRDQAYLNTTVDNFRFRQRFRLGFDAQITQSLMAQFRFATSNLYNPVSNNQNLATYGETWQFAIDRAFLQYDFVDSVGRDWFTVWGGRMPNPFFSTDVVYDPDLSFAGVATTVRLSLDREDPVLQSYRVPNPVGRFGVNLGPQRPNTLFATLGAFPIQETNFAPQGDKWLYGFQLGGDWLFGGDTRLKLAGSYYDYERISAIRNPYESFEYNWTAPQFMQKGNSLVAINDAQNQPSTCNVAPLGSQNVCLVGLASGFKIVNATMVLDNGTFAPVHLMLTLDYAKNLGFDRQKILAKFGDDISEHTNAYQARLDIGRDMLIHFNDWSFYVAYRYLERDAVLDAFTDSVFHMGGTDAKGYVLGLQYGLAFNTWLNIRWFSTDAINNPPLSIDTLTVDLNARF